MDLSTQNVLLSHREFVKIIIIIIILLLVLIFYKITGKNEVLIAYKNVSYQTKLNIDYQHGSQIKI